IPLGTSPQETGTSCTGALEDELAWLLDTEDSDDSAEDSLDISDVLDTEETLPVPALEEILDTEDWLERLDIDALLDRLDEERTGREGIADKLPSFTNSSKSWYEPLERLMAS